MTVRRDYASIASGQLGLAAINVVIGFLLARVADPATVGQWFFVSSLAQLGVAVASGGIGQELVRRLAIPDVAPETVWRSALRALFSVTTSIVLLIVVPGGWLISDYVDGPDPGRLAWLAVAILVGQMVLRAGMDLARGVVRLNLAAMMSGWFERAIFAVAIAAFLVADRKLALTEIISYQLLGMLIVTAIAFPKLRAAWAMVPRGVVRGDFRLRDTKRLGISNVLLRVVMVGDIVLGAFFLTPTELAQYGIALRVAALVALPVRAATMVALPHLSRSVADNRPSLGTIGPLVKASSALSAIIVAGLILFGRSALRLGFGPEYVDAMPLIIVLAGSQFVNALTGPSQAALMAGNHDNAVLAQALVGAIVLVVGAAIASVIGTALSLAVFSALATVVTQMVSWNSARTLMGIRTDALSRR